MCAAQGAGLTSLDALHAPLLIDSYSPQQRVLQGPLVKDMLQALRPLGLSGLGVLPGPMRKPLGITRPLVEPSDYRGLMIGIQKSRVADATMRALGAAAVPFPVAGAIDRFGGIESQVGAIQGNRYGEVGKYLTANVDLWPRPIVLFANRATFDGLSEAARHPPPSDHRRRSRRVRASAPRRARVRRSPMPRGRAVH